MLQFFYRHVYEFGNSPPAYLYVRGLLFQACAVAVGAYGLSSVSGKHYAILYLVLVCFEHTEESVYAYLLFFGQASFLVASVPENVFFPLRQFVVWGEDGEFVFLCAAAEFVVPQSHFFSAPANNGSFVNVPCLVGHDEVLVYSECASYSAAGGTCAERGVEREHVFLGFFEQYAVGLEAC